MAIALVPLKNISTSTILFSVTTIGEDKVIIALISATAAALVALVPSDAEVQHHKPIHLL